MFARQTINDVIHADFARRMQAACDANVDVPPLHQGRLGWIAEQLHRRFRYKVTKETVRKWLSGQSRPRSKKMPHLAAVLQVDEAWLARGLDVGAQERHWAARSAAATGAVNILAGFIKMCGGSPAFPEPHDESAAKDHVHLYAVIQRVQYRLHIAVGQPTHIGWLFYIPYEATRDVLVIGLTRPDELACRFHKLDRERVENEGVRKCDTWEIEIAESDLDAKWARISKLSEGL